MITNDFHSPSIVAFPTTSQLCYHLTLLSWIRLLDLQRFSILLSITNYLIYLLNLSYYPDKIFASEMRQLKYHVLSVLTYKVLHDSAPRYLGPLVTVADLPGRRALRSASTSRLVIPPIKLSTVGSRSFPVAAAQVWNSLPEAVISSSSLQSFRRQLKTYLFQLSCPHLIL